MCSLSVAGLAHLARFAKIELIDGHMLSPGMCSGLSDFFLFEPSRGVRQCFVVGQVIHSAPSPSQIVKIVQVAGLPDDRAMKPDMHLTF